MPDPSPAPSPTLSAGKAVLIGHLIVNLPVLVIMLAAYFLGRRFQPALGFGIVLGAFVIAWVWWALSLPRWRKWALRRGAPEDRLQQLAAQTGLAWKKGSVFEKTEIKDDE